MKAVASILLLFAVGTLAKPAVDLKDLTEKLTECREYYGITEDAKITSKNSYLLKLFSICIAKYEGLLNTDGTVNMKNLVSRKKEGVDTKDLSDIVEKCEASFVEKKDLQETIKYMDCLDNNKVYDYLNMITE